MIQDSKLKKRLEHIWLPPDFSSFFSKYTKRSPLKIKAGKTIFHEGDIPDKLYFVKSGFVKMYRMSPEGRSTIIYLYGPGSILAIRALTMPDKELKHTAEAITDVEIMTMPEKDYIEALVSNPEYIVDLLSVFIDRLNYTERKLEGFILTDSTARVASFLYDLTQRFGKPVGGGKLMIPLPLTHQTIAEFVGAFRETVTVAANRLTKDGVIESKRGKMTILSLEKLKKQALI